MGRFIFFAVIVLLAFLWYGKERAEDEKRATEAARRSKLESKRASDPDTLKALAGCMANRASVVAHIEVATVIHKVDTGDPFNAEELASYKTMRSALLEGCPAHLDAVRNSYKSLTEQQLNAAFLAVMREDPGVQEFLESYRLASQATKKIYVKD